MPLSYKFALAKSLLEIAPTGRTEITLEALAEPFSIMLTIYMYDHILAIYLLKKEHIESDTEDTRSDGIMVVFRRLLDRWFYFGDDRL